MTDLAVTRGLIDDWRSYLVDTPPSWRIDDLRRSTQTGRPLGDAGFVDALECRLGRRLRPKKR